MALPPILVIVAFVGIPVVVGFLFTLGHVGGLNAIPALIGQHVYKTTNWFGTFAAYVEVFTNAGFLQDVGVTILITVVATGFVLALAAAVGLYLRFHDNFVGHLLSSLTVIPLFIPVVIASWAVLTFYNGTGLLRSVFALLGGSFPTLGFTTSVVIIASIWNSLPFAFLMIASGLQSIPDALIETAKDAGAGQFQIIKDILLPLAYIPFVIAATFTGINIIGSFTIPFLVGPNQPTMLGVTLSNYFTNFNQPQQSLVMAFAVFVLAAAIGAFYVWANFRSAADDQKESDG